MPRQFDQFLRSNAVFLIGVMRMGTDRAIDVWKSFGDRQQRGNAPDARRNADDAANASGICPRYDRIEIVGEIRKIQMAMAIDEHGLPAQAAEGSTERGNTGGGGGSTVPGLIRVAPPSAAKSRASWGMPRLSSNFAEDSGITGCARMAICRTTSAVTYNTVCWRCGSVFANAHGASPAK